MKEVYIAKGLNGEILYVGQGSEGRNTHCLNGTSHNKHLNRYFFQNGEDGCITTEVVKIVETQDCAAKLEKELIKKLQPIFNVVTYGSVRSQHPTKKRKSKNFKFYAKAVYDNFNTDEGVVASIFTEYPVIKEYVDELGVDALRSCSFQESRIKKKFMQAIGAKGLDSNRTDVRSVLNLTKNCWYSLKEIKGLLSQAYKKLNYTSKAFASDIDKYYVVKRSRRSGVEGVLIICNA